MEQKKFKIDMISQSQNYSSQKYTVGGIAIPGLKLYFWTVVTKTA